MTHFCIKGLCTYLLKYKQKPIFKFVEQISVAHTALAALTPAVATSIDYSPHM